LQGEWLVIAYSYNKGVNTHFANPPYIFAYVSDVTASLGDGSVLSTQSVKKDKGEDGADFDAVLFKNGVIWVVSDISEDSGTKKPRKKHEAHTNLSR
jgi:hypothetical protein